MDNLEDKINSVLSSPDQLAKIMALAKSLTTSNDEEETERHVEVPDDTKHGDGIGNLLGALGGDGIGNLLGALGGDGIGNLLGALGGDGIGNLLGALGGDGIGSLLGALGGDGGPGQLLGGLGPDTLPFLVSLLSVYNEKDDSRAHLLKSLHPYLSSRRRGKVDRAVQYMRIARTMKVALDHFKGET